MRNELLELTTALKNHVISERESRSGLNNLCLKRESSTQSSVSVDASTNDRAVHSPSITLEDIGKELGDCKRCKLHDKRHHIVFGEGSPHADIVFVGEAPGRDEDMQGKPFVGRAGQLLTNIIKAMGLERRDVYICNILKCRPPQNRNPEPDEIAACEPFLVKQLEAIQPCVICAMGKFAAQTLLKTGTAISMLRGRFHSYHGIKLMPTYHPAYLLRNPGAKKQVWEDVQIIMEELKQGSEIRA
ncbi:MAG: uracil-DNA glycosylase [Syntrophobacterales bacterium]|nr:uracil-DNA glycosylase [Syntrophobacterales bacterium]